MRVYLLLAVLLVMAGLTAWAFAEKARAANALREAEKWQTKAEWTEAQLIAERATSTKYRALADTASKEAIASRARAALAEDAARALIDEIRAEEARPELVPEQPEARASAPANSCVLGPDWRRRLQDSIPVRRPTANPSAAGQRGGDAVP